MALSSNHSTRSRRTSNVDHEMLGGGCRDYIKEGAPPSPEGKRSNATAEVRVRGRYASARERCSVSVPGLMESKESRLRATVASGGGLIPQGVSTEGEVGVEAQTPTSHTLETRPCTLPLLLDDTSDCMASVPKEWQCASWGILGNGSPPTTGVSGIGPFNVRLRVFLSALAS